MKENYELMEHIYKDAEMASYTLTKLIRDLKDKDNKIKKTLEDIMKEYESWKKKAMKYLKKGKAEITDTSFFEKYCSMNSCAFAGSCSTEIGLSSSARVKPKKIKRQMLKVINRFIVLCI